MSRAAWIVIGAALGGAIGEFCDASDEMGSSDTASNESVFIACR
jgi:hypothetical protein